MLPGIELHHEALDGRGYPYGLEGDQIPLLARIIAVADTFDALTTNRPYQHAHTPEEALKIIQNLAGKRLDPVPVAALMALYARGEIRIQRLSIRRLATPDANIPPVPAALTDTADEIAKLEKTRA
jgi:HD-GYP domain-containing protein (c-di-GMP phosphodiesterase class II)